MNPAHGTWKAVVFDFDGTLAKLNIDFGAMRSGLLGLMSRFAIPSGSIDHLHILEMIDAAASRLAEHRPEAAPVFLDAARAMVTEMEIAASEEGTLFEGTRKLLGELKNRSIRTGVVTRNCRAAVLRVFPDIDRYCQVLLTRDDISRVKPHPDHLCSALDALDVAPFEAVMVGDHPMDIHLGREAGTYTIGVLSGHSGRESLIQAKADLVIADIFDILALIS